MSGRSIHARSNDHGVFALLLRWHLCGYRDGGPLGKSYWVLLRTTQKSTTLVLLRDKPNQVLPLGNFNSLSDTVSSNQFGEFGYVDVVNSKSRVAKMKCFVR
ncbi:hypothetical protein OK016_02405 [Vibrio chagasii]|nr:hypothetical protein [Vibrio chagasii]